MRARRLQWKDVAIEALKAAVILAILERLYLTSNARWLEVRATRVHCSPGVLTRVRLQDHIDYISLQALLVKRHGLGIVGQVRTFWHHSKRLAD